MRELSTTILVVSSMAMLCSFAAQAGDTWDGGGANDNWSNGLNWNPGMGLQFPPPNNGSANLSFPAFGGIVHQPLIDVPYSINSMTFGSGSGRYVILGAAELTIGAGGIINNDADIQSIIGTVKLNADQSWNAAVGPLQFDAVNLNGFDLTCTGNFPITLPSVIVGNGSVNVAGGIQVTMSGGNNNSFTGTTQSNNGTLVLQKTGGALAVPGDLLINASEPGTPATVRLAGNEQISHALNHTVHVYPGGLLDVNTRTETLDTLWLDGGDATTTGAGRLTARNAIVNGSTATWTNSDTLIVGDAATGSLSISSGGDVTSGYSYIGRLASATGTVTINGSGSIWDNSGGLWVGEHGSGALNILAGADLSVGGGGVNHSYVGFWNGSTGEVTVDGTGSTWTTTGVLDVGFDNSTGGGGDATVNIQSNADVNVGSYVWIGSGDEINVSNGGSFNVTGDVTFFGGSLTADTNAAVTCAGWTMESGASATVQNDATLTNVGGLQLQSDVTMQINSGATCTTGFAKVGSLPGPPAYLLIDGAGTLFSEPSCCIDVGYGGTGEMRVTGGARVESPTGAVGSFGVNSVGIVVLDGTDAQGNPSSWVFSAGPNLGLHATSHGTISILNGALLSAASSLTVGNPGNASVFVQGRGSTNGPSLLDVGELTIGNGFYGPGTGAVEASAGGRIEAGNIVMTPAGTATLTITDLDTTLVQSGASTITVGNASAGAAEINVQNNATFISGTGAITINATGEINIASGGVFDARGPITLNSGGELNMLGGTLHVDAFNGNLLNQAGTLAPGHSPGVTAISGNYIQQAGATLQIEIADVFPGEWDVVNVQGNALLNGTLEVVLLDGFQPVVGNTFTILTTNVGNVGGAFDALHLPPGMQVTYAPHAVTLEMTEAPCLGDVNNSGFVDVDDLIAVILGWGCTNPPGPCPADANGSGVVDVDDLIAVILAWGACP